MADCIDEALAQQQLFPFHFIDNKGKSIQIDRLPVSMRGESKGCAKMWWDFWKWKRDGENCQKRTFLYTPDKKGEIVKSARHSRVSDSFFSFEKSNLKIEICELTPLNFRENESLLFSSRITSNLRRQSPESRRSTIWTGTTRTVCCPESECRRTLITSAIESIASSLDSCPSPRWVSWQNSGFQKMKTNLELIWNFNHAAICPLEKLKKKSYYFSERRKICFMLLTTISDITNLVSKEKQIFEQIAKIKF